MAEYNGTNMVFDSEAEQLTYELNCLITAAKDPQFKTYLENSLDEMKDYQNPMKLRDKIVENYNIYVQRMIRLGKNVDAVYEHAIYGDMGDPEIKSPYSNISPYSNESPYSNNTVVQKRLEPQTEPAKEKVSTGTIIKKTLTYIACYMGLNYICSNLSRVLAEYLLDVLNYNTLLGKIIYLSIFSLVFGNIYFWALLSISKLLIHKYSVAIGICLVVLGNIIGIIFIQDWVTVIMWFIQLSSMIFPLIIRWSETS